MAVTFVCRRSATQTGVVLAAFLPLPSWPEELSPQASTRPVLVSARAQLPQALTAVIRTPRGSRTQTGASWFAR